MKTIVGNAAAQVVDVVQPHVSGKPLQDRRQLEVRAAAHGSDVEIPSAVAFPMCTVELMLDIKQPIPDPRRDKHHGEVGRNYRQNAEGGDGEPEHDRKDQVQPQDAAA